MKKKQVKLALLLAVASLTLLSSTACGSKTEEIPPSPVEVNPGDTVRGVTGDGNLSLPRKVELTFGNSGTVEVLDVEEGDRVEQGQILSQLDNSSFERAVAEAERRIENTQANLDKLLNPPNLAADIREAEADVESAKAALAYVVAIYVAEGSYPEGLHKKSQVESAEATLVKAEERLADLLDGPDKRDVQLAENEASAHHGFGAACLQIGLVDGAVEHCRRAVELEPRLIEAHCDLTVGYFRQGRWWKALKQVWGIVRLSAGNSQLRRRVLGGLERRLIRSRKR